MSKDKTNKKDASNDEKDQNEAADVEIQDNEDSCKAETVTIEALEDKLNDLEAEKNEFKDQYLRKSADFENFRKRMVREKEDAIHFANSTLLLDLIAIIDDFERAIKSAEESQDSESFLEGIVLIEKQFVSMLERKWGLRRFESKDEDFDPEKHEALYMEESPEVEKPVVVEDYQKGFILHDRVLRHSKVKVLMPEQNNDEKEKDD